MNKTQSGRSKSEKKPAKKEAFLKNEKLPWWQQPLFWLIVVPLLVYAKIVLFDFTALDDQFFVLEHASFNENFENIFKVFNQGLFVPKNDIYYRPVFLVDMIIENHLFGTSPWGYHMMSLVFHTVSVMLLFIFLKKISVPEFTALISSLIFAVHPVLTQTVAWIPGRNDLILMIFFLTALIFIIDYCKTASYKALVFQFSAFLLALLTKETGVMIPVIALLLIGFHLKLKITKYWPLPATWIIALLIWYGLRASSEPSYQGMLFREMVESGLTRIPALLQYLGKIFFPVNLSAVPRFEDITLLWGTLALILLIFLVIYSKTYRNPLVFIGISWYFLLLLPVLIVPKNLNDQLYEHRLYLPVVGILIVLSQTVVFSEKWPKQKMVIAMAGLIVILSVVSFFRLNCYRNRQVFWEQAVKDSPTSAFARLNQGIQSTIPEVREKHIREAYTLDPREMLVNYWMGITMQRLKKTDSAVYFYKTELSHSNFPDLYFNLSQCLFDAGHLDSAAYYLAKGIELDPTKTAAVTALANVYFKLAESAYQRYQFDSTAYYLQQVTRFDPMNAQAFHNLAMVLFQHNQRDKALAVMEQMRMKGINITPDLVNLSK